MGLTEADMASPQTPQERKQNDNITLAPRIKESTKRSKVVKKRSGGFMYERNIEKYRERLFGLIDEKNIICTEIPRPPKEIIDAFYQYAGGLTPTISDILDSMGLIGSISASTLKPVIPGKVVIGPVVTLRYLFERKTPTQGFVEKNIGHMADRDAYAVAQPGDIVVYDADGREVSCQGDCPPM